MLTKFPFTSRQKPHELHRLNIVSKLGCSKDTINFTYTFTFKELSYLGCARSWYNACLLSSRLIMATRKHLMTSQACLR